MKDRFFLWFLLMFFLSSVLPARAMFLPPEGRSKVREVAPPAHLSAFHRMGEAPKAAFRVPRRRIDFAKIYFRKPPLDAKQKAALARLGPAIRGFEIHFDERTGLPVFLKGAPLYRPSFQGLRASVSPREAALAALEHFRDLLRLKAPGREFRLRQELQDTAGRHHLRLAQVYQGVPYFGKELIVHLDQGGAVYLIEGRYAATPTGLEVTPVISAAEACRRAAEELGASEEACYETELVIYEDRAGIPRLSWRVDACRGPAGCKRFFIDAKTGLLFHYYRLVYEAAVPGSGTDEQTGARHQFSVWQEGGTYYFIDTSLPLHEKDPSVGMGDFGRGNVAILYLPYGDPTLGIDWLTSSSPDQWPAAAVSVWYGLKETLSYYERVHGRRGMDGRNKSAVGAINLSGANAFYSSEYNDFTFFGIGDGYQFGPLTALDVVAHEFTHGVTNYTARLEYQYQSGALNEAFSDIFAAMVDRDDWLMGEDVVRVPPYCLRNLEDPHRSLQPQPATMDEYQVLPFTEDNGGVHINSTIPSHAAYLLARAVGREKAERIFYKVLTEHLTPQSDFWDFCRATVQAAEELFGAQEAEAARNACQGVRITLEGGEEGGEEPPPVPPISGGDYVLFFFYELGDDFSFVPYIGVALPDGNAYYLSETPAEETRPAPYHYQGQEYALFVDQDHNLRAANILSEQPEEWIINSSGEIWSIATTPSLERVVYTTIYETDNHLYLWDPVTNRVDTVEIRFVPPDSAVSLETLYPDVVSFSPDGQAVFFDCFNRIKFGQTRYEFWTIGKLDLTDKSTRLLLPIPPQGYHLGNPAAGQVHPNLVAFDLIHEEQVETRILNLSSGQTGLVWRGQVTFEGPSGWPYFNGDDTYLYLQDLDEFYSQTMALIRIPLQEQGGVWRGIQEEAELALYDPEGIKNLAMPVVFRPGSREVNPEARVSPTSLEFGAVSLGQSKSLTLSLQNVGNYPLEFLGSEIEGGEEVFGVKALHTLIDPGETYEIQVVFTPREETTYRGILRLYTSDQDHREITVPLSGEGRAGSANLEVDVKVNGSDGPLGLGAGDTLRIELSLEPAGQNEGDYFLWAQLPEGTCYCYLYPGRWLPCSCNAPVPAYQGPVVRLRELRVFETPAATLPRGTYRLFFAVDTLKNGSLDERQEEKDEIIFTIN